MERSFVLAATLAAIVVAQPVLAQTFPVKPPDLVTRINGEVVRIINLPDIREKLSTAGAFPVGDTPQQFGQWLASEKDRWAKLIKDTGFKLEQ